MNSPVKRRRTASRDTFAILVALSAGRQTGSEIQSRIVADTLGVYVKPSSLYAALHRLQETALVDNLHNYYGLTDPGWKHLKNETRTLELLVSHSKRRLMKSGKIDQQ